VSLVYSRTDNGLLVAENASGDERAVARALKEYDPDLRLVPAVVKEQVAWKVYRHSGPDRPALFLFMWGDEYGNPWPLSYRILDKVKTLDKNTSTGARDEDALEAHRKASKAKEEETLRTDLYDDWKSLDGRIPHMKGVR
jgi:hypothetical protein